MLALSPRRSLRAQPIQILAAHAHLSRTLALHQRDHGLAGKKEKKQSQPSHQNLAHARHGRIEARSNGNHTKRSHRQHHQRLARQYCPRRSPLPPPARRRKRRIPRPRQRIPPRGPRPPAIQRQLLFVSRVRRLPRLRVLSPLARLDPRLQRKPDQKPQRQQQPQRNIQVVPPARLMQRRAKNINAARRHPHDCPNKQPDHRPRAHPLRDRRTRRRRLRRRTRNSRVMVGSELRLLQHVRAVYRCTEYPPPPLIYSGDMATHFSPEALKFLRGLARHNDRAWFDPRKPIYEREVRQPMLALIDEINHAFASFAPDHIRPPHKIMMRIYRDTRFDASRGLPSRPYKTNAAAWWLRTGLEKTSGAGFYFHFSP